MSEREGSDRRRGSGSGGGSKTLSLKSGGGSEAGRVRQSFSHGRSKSVVVETKSKKRVINKPKEGAATQSTRAPAGDAVEKAAREAGISKAELERRKKALEAAQVAEVERKKREAEEAERRAEEEARRKVEEEERKRRAAEEAARRKAEEEESAQREAEEAAARAATVSVAQTKEAPKKAPAAPAEARSRDEGDSPRRPAAVTPAAPRARAPEPPKKQPAPSRGRGDDRRKSKLTINRALSGDEGRQKSIAAMKRRQEKQRKAMMGGTSNKPTKVYRDVVIPEAITVQELANRMTERAADVVKQLMTMGVMARMNDTIDQDTAELLVAEFGHRVKRVSESDVEESLITQQDDDPSKLKPRAPVVTVMGHVDHGKTSLLDALRKTSVVSGEAGGITQHIGAYQVNTDGGGLITFLDTPGHAAFTSMRARGAQVTDIVILVVAADDSVMPQTIEAINHAKAAEVPMIIAINKCDKPDADPQKVRVELLQHDVQVESMGGEVLDVEVSAITGQGLDKIIENILLQSELLELKANPDRSAEGAVIEAKLDVGRGPVATVLVQRGTLNNSDIFVVGEQWGKVRAMINDQGDRVKEAGPSLPVEVLGLNGAPEAGDVMVVVDSEARAREIADYRQRKAKEKQAAAGAKTTLDQLLAQAKADENVAELPILMKGDVQGSVEAIAQALEKIGNEEVRVRLLHSGVGAITESDVTLAEASNAPIIGFNVRANAPARDAAQQKGVEIRYYSVIYDLVDDVTAAASGLLKPEVKETFIGYATIKEVFKITGIGKVAGCEVTEGVARRSAGVRLLRDNVVIHEGTLKTLKRFKDEVKEVLAGQECGMAFENYEDIREADVIEIFEREEVERSL